MRRVGSSASNDRGAASPGPSAALAEPDQGTVLPVQLLRDTPAAAKDADHAQGFAPEELLVRSLVVTGQRKEEHRDPRGGSYSLKQKVYRQMPLPADLDPAAATCSLTPSGQLWVRGPCRPLALPESPPGRSPSLTHHGSRKGPRPHLTQ